VRRATEEAAEHRAALGALVDVLREARALARGERPVQRIRHHALGEAVISMHAIPSGHVHSPRSTPRPAAPRKPVSEATGPPRHGSRQVSSTLTSD